MGDGLGDGLGEEGGVFIAEVGCIFPCVRDSGKYTMANVRTLTLETLDGGGGGGGGGGYRRRGVNVRNWFHRMAYEALTGVEPLEP